MTPRFVLFNKSKEISGSHVNEIDVCLKVNTIRTRLVELLNVDGRCGHATYVLVNIYIQSSNILFDAGW